MQILVTTQPPPSKHRLNLKSDNFLQMPSPDSGQYPSQYSPSSTRCTNFKILTPSILHFKHVESNININIYAINSNVTNSYEAGHDILNTSRYLMHFPNIKLL